MTCSRSCSQCQSWDQSTRPPAVSPVLFPTASQSRMPRRRAIREEGCNYRPDLMQMSALHGHGPQKAPDSATPSHPWTPPLPGQSRPGRSTLRKRCTSQQSGDCQMLSSQGRAGSDISKPTCGSPLVLPMTSGVAGQALNP